MVTTVLPGDEDPGWRGSARKATPYALYPSLALTRRPGSVPPVVALRAVFLGFTVMVLGFGVVVLFLMPVTTDAAVDPVAYALVGAGPLGLVGAAWARRRFLGTWAPPAELAEAYRASLMLGLAFSESAALPGFVASFMAGAAWPYLVGLVVTLVGFAAMAPTAGRLRSLDDELMRRGCQHSLRAGLFQAAADPATSCPPT